MLLLGTRQLYLYSNKLYKMDIYFSKLQGMFQTKFISTFESCFHTKFHMQSYNVSSFCNPTNENINMLYMNFAASEYCFKALLPYTTIRFYIQLCYCWFPSRSLKGCQVDTVSGRVLKTIMVQWLHTTFCSVQVKTATLLKPDDRAHTESQTHASFFLWKQVIQCSQYITTTTHQSIAKRKLLHWKTRIHFLPMNDKTSCITRLRC
jgi:hypothetical protein